MVSMGNPVNTSGTQRKVSLDMGSRLVPEHGTEGNLRKLLFLARSRPHKQGHPGAKKESGPTTEEGHELPKGLMESSQSSHPAGNWVPLELAPSYEVTPPRDPTATWLRCSRSGCREEGAGPRGCSTSATFEAWRKRKYVILPRTGLPHFTEQ